MAIAKEMQDRLMAAFSPENLEIIDESEAHRGHAGFQEGGESHFVVQISTAPFAEMSRIKRHRAVHTALGQDIIARIHALSIEFT